MVNLFDFAKQIGKKLFGNDDDDEAKAAKIKESLKALGEPGLDVKVSGGQVILSGSAASAEAREKAVLMAGNVEGVENVVADALQAPPPPEPVEYYIIEKGDTLSKIAKRYYGNASAYPRIFEANREVIEHPDKIYPGQKIRIPGVKGGQGGAAA